FFFSSRRRHTRFSRDWSSDVCFPILLLLLLIGLIYYTVRKVSKSDIDREGIGTLVYGKGGRELESRNLHIEMFSVPGEVHHMVMAPHGAYWRGQEAAGTVGVGFPRGDHGLSSDDPFPVDGLHVLQGVENVPVPGGELYGILAKILYGNGVAKGVMHPVVLEKGALETGMHRHLYSICHFGHLTCHRLIIDKNTSCKRNYQYKEGQDEKDRIEKQKLAYGLEPSLSIKFSHGLVQIDPENQQKYSGAVNLEQQVQQQAYDEQDKQEGLIVEREDQMIGVGVVFSDVRQPNEKGEQGQEEKYDQGELGKGG